MVCSGTYAPILKHAIVFILLWYSSMLFSAYLLLSTHSMISLLWYSSMLTYLILLWFPSMLFPVHLLLSILFIISSDTQAYYSLYICCWVSIQHNCYFRCAYLYSVMFMATLFSIYSSWLNRTVHLHSNAKFLICTALGGVFIKLVWLSYPFIHLMLCFRGVATNHQKGKDWKCIQSQGVWEDGHLAPRFGFDG